MANQWLQRPVSLCRGAAGRAEWGALHGQSRHSQQPSGLPGPSGRCGQRWGFQLLSLRTSEVLH